MILTSTVKDYILASGLFTPAADWPVQYRFDENKYSNKNVLIIRSMPSAPNNSGNTESTSYDIYLMGRPNLLSDEPALESKLWQLRDYFQSYNALGLPHTKIDCIINVKVLTEPFLFGETDTNRILFKMSMNIQSSSQQIRG
jgi:hypothetical protein